jgi:hypothetical protein
MSTTLDSARVADLRRGGHNQQRFAGAKVGPCLR